jgi:hypothetical protein
MKEKLPTWTEGLEATLKKNNTHLLEQYSWHGMDDSGKFVFITEADHKNPNSSIVDLRAVTVVRNIDPAADDWHANTARHSAEVFAAVKLANKMRISVKVLLTKYSKYSINPKPSIKAMMLPWDFSVTSFKGNSHHEGYSFTLSRI